MRQDHFTSKKSVAFAESNLLLVLEAEVKLFNMLINIILASNLLLVLEAEVKLSNMLIKMIFNYARTKRLWIKSNGAELTMLTSSTVPALDLIDFIQTVMF